MAAPPAGAEEFVELAARSRVVEAARLAEWRATPAAQALLAAGAPARDAARQLVEVGLLTPFQAGFLLKGQYKGFFLGPYVVEERLGVGGMSQVFRARHSKLRRRVALKLLPDKLASNELVLARFHREARAAAALDHPNIVRALDLHEGAGGNFLVMEYAEGEDLAHMVKRAGPLPPAVTREYAAQVLAGLQHVHEASLVHRDIKPGNLLLDRTGVVKILDMGLARFVDERQDGLTDKLGETALMGTADYMSPEQSLNMSDVDIRSDLYSLGATLYHLLTGRPPFEGLALSQKLLAMQMQEPELLRQARPDVPPELAAFVHRLLAKKPEERYQTPAEALAALVGPEAAARAAEPPAHQALRLQSAVPDTAEHVPVVAPTPEAAPTLPAASSPRRDRRLVAMAIAVAAGLAAGAVAWALADGFLSR